MKISAGLPPGVSALLFDAARGRRRLEARLCGILEDEGCSEVLLPILDYFDPYEPLLSDSSRDRLYRFVDRDGQLLALRGDFTPMLARLIAPRLSSLELPQKLYYRGDVVRYQEVRPGRMREYSELGVELLDAPRGDLAAGDRSKSGSDEAGLTLFIELLIAAGTIDAGTAASSGEEGLRVVVGCAGALDHLVIEAGGQPDTLAAVARRDREVARAMSRGLAEIVETGRPKSLDCLGAASARRVADLLALCQELETRFGDRGVHVSLDLAEFASSTLDPALNASASGVDSGETLDSDARSSSYYDGIVFKAYLQGETHPVGRGGRYDRLFRALGADVSATGFSLGLDRLLPSGELAPRVLPRAAGNGSSPGDPT